MPLADTRRAPSWLCRDETDRERLLDMERRIRPLRAAAMSVLGVALLATGPWLGFWTIIPLVAAAAGFAVMDRNLERAARPEYRMAAAWLMSECAIAGSIALTGGVKSPALAWLAVPVVTLSARFSARGVMAGMAVVTGLLLTVTLGTHPSHVINAPEALILALALIAAVALLSMALMKSDLHHRSVSLIDPLTSMLNRNALQARVAELSQQARIAPKPIGVIVGDLDRFKLINDEHGHSTGDAVLREVAYRLRKHLRAFDLAYRLGGEEFIVLLPGADLSSAQAVADKLREAIAAEPCGGHRVTMTFGVSASQPGSFDFDATFAEADAALYAGKRSGRDRVNTTSAQAALVPA